MLKTSKRYVEGYLTLVITVHQPGCRHAPVERCALYDEHLNNLTSIGYGTIRRAGSDPNRWEYKGCKACGTHNFDRVRDGLTALHEQHAENVSRRATTRAEKVQREAARTSLAEHVDAARNQLLEKLARDHVVELEAVEQQARQEWEHRHPEQFALLQSE